LKNLFKDPLIIKEMRKLYKNKKIATDKLVALLHEGKLTIAEYVAIIKE
jgi:hypothetical protein